MCDVKGGELMLAHRSWSANKTSRRPFRLCYFSKDKLIFRLPNGCNHSGSTMKANEILIPRLTYHMRHEDNSNITDARVQPAFCQPCRHCIVFTQVLLSDTTTNKDDVGVSLNHALAGLKSSFHSVLFRRHTTKRYRVSRMQ